MNAATAGERPTTQAASVDHYAILKIESTATDADVKAAYRRRAKETHPDVGGDAEEFKLVQAAYDVLGNAEMRRRYDSGQSIGEERTIGITIPDLIGKSVTDAVKIATTHQLAARVAIVEVANSNRLRGYVVGQMPYPGVETTAGVVGLLVAVPQASTLWQRFRVAATELATGFMVGIRNSTVSGVNRQAELGAGSGLHNAGAVAGEVVGTLAVGAVDVAIGAVNFAAKAFLVFVFTIFTIISLVLLAFAPPLGLIMGGLTGWMIYSASKKSRQRK